MAPPISSIINKWQEICLDETPESVSSVSTVRYVPQPLENKSHFVCNRLFVGGFPPGTTARELTNVFSDHGKVIGCNIMSQDATKNYGFVTFQTVSSAEAVLDIASKKRAFFLRGHALKIKRAVFKPRKAVSDGVETSLYRGKHDTVRYYKGTTQFMIYREDIRGYSNTAGGMILPKVSAWPAKQSINAPPPHSYYAQPTANVLPSAQVYLPSRYPVSFSTLPQHFTGTTAVPAPVLYYQVVPKPISMH